MGLRTKNALLLVTAILPGCGIAAVAGYYALVDWNALQSAYGAFEHAAANHAEIRDLIVAEARQNIHRVNLFADGVWTLLGLILLTLGVIGWSSPNSAEAQGSRAEKG